MNAPAETAPANTAYLKVLEALVQINEPAERERIATKADISPDGAGVQLVALAGKRIVVRCPQPKGAPALWSLAVSLDTARQMVAGMKRAAAEASPAADDRRRIIAAMREIGAPASAFAIAKKSDVEMSNFSLFLEAMAADGVIRRIGGTSGQRPKFALIPSVQSQTPAATDGEPGDGTPNEDRDETQAQAEPERPGVDDTEEALARRQIALARELMACGCRPGEGFDDPDDFGDDEPAPEPGDTQAVDAVEAAPVAGHAASLDDPDDFGDDEIPPAAAYDATVEAEAKADEAPLAGEDVCGADAVIAEWKREHAPAAPAAPADQDTPLGCAIARITGPLIAQAEEWESDALRLRHIIGEAIRLASDAQARTPGVSEAHKALEIAASIIEDVQ